MAFENYLPRRRTNDRWQQDEGRLMPTFGSSPRLGRLFDDMFNDFFSGFPAGRDLATFTPRVNVSDNENDIRITAELPGMDEKDIDVSLTREGLILRGEKREERSEGEKNQYYECSYGSFERFIPLPVEVKEEEAEARFNRGVLTITLPKTDESRSQRKRIQVRAGQGGEEKRRPIDVENERSQQGNGRSDRQSTRSNAARGTQGEGQAAR